MSHLLANAEIPTGCRPPTIVEGRETDLWVDGRKEGSNRGSRDGVHVVAITRGKEMVETNPCSSNQPNQHVIRSSVFATETCVTIVLKYLPESTATRILVVCVFYDDTLKRAGG
jgi:hypothetical protein